MNSDGNKEIVRRFFAQVWNDADVGAVEQFVHPGFMGHTGKGSRELGYEGLRQLVRNFHERTEEGRLVLQDLIAEGDRVVARLFVEGIRIVESPNDSPVKKRIRIHNVRIFRMVDGRAAEVWDAMEPPVEEPLAEA